MNHAARAKIFARRGDRFSELVAKGMDDEWDRGYLVTKGTLSPEEHEEMLSLLPEAHEKVRAELQSAMDSLRTQLARFDDPLLITAHVQMRTIWNEWGSYYEPTQAYGEHFVELVAGLLCTRMDRSDASPPAEDAFAALMAEFDHIMEVLFVLNLTTPRGDDLDAATLRFLSRFRWLWMRGDSYASHGVELAEALYAPHAAWMRTTYGFEFPDVVRVGQAVMKLVEDRIHSLGPESFKQGKEMVAAYLKAHASVGKPSQSEREELERQGAAMLFGASFRDAMTVTAAEIAASDPAIAESTAIAVLTEFSVSAGSLDPGVYTGLFDVNPLKERPFLESGGRYLLASPAMLVRDAVRLMEARLIAGQPGYPASRARTLDDLAIKYLSAILPGATAHTRLFYNVPERVEVDGLVIIDDLAIVVEGKGSAISVAGLRGDTVRLGRDIQESVEDAWVQGARARDYILGPGDSVFYDEENNEDIRIPEGAVSEVHIVNPTLHELGGHAPQLPRLRSLGVFPTGEYPWSVYINDLRVISETCENPAIFLHYLVWRDRLPLGDRATVSDELDIWGSYLLNERFGMLADADSQVGIGNYTTDFDAYYDGIMGRGPKRSKPRKLIRGLVERFVDEVAEQRPPGWRHAAGVCLDLSTSELAMVDHEAANAARAAAEHSTVVGKQVGRVGLIGVPTGADRPTLAQARELLEDPTLVICSSLKSARRGGRPAIIWAEYGRSVSFELSDFEVWAQEQLMPDGREVRPQS